MRVLVVASYNKNRFAPFIVEQVDALKQSGCEIEWFGVHGKGITGYLKEIPRLRRAIREARPDVIHAHYGLSCLLANLATRRVPIVSTYHGSDINLVKVRPFSKIAIWLSAWNIFVSKRNMALAGEVEGDKCSLIPCGVTLTDEQLQTREEARAALGWSRDEKKVLFAGAFDNAVKDPSLAIQAMNELRNEGLNAELVELKGYARSEVNRLMCAANCLLMTSKTEGSPQVIKEAMACGCPIVSVEVGDVAERIEEVWNSYVVKGREPRELAKKLMIAISSDGKTNGRLKILEYGLTNEQVARRIITIYRILQNQDINRAQWVGA